MKKKNFNWALIVYIACAIVFAINFVQDFCYGSGIMQIVFDGIAVAIWTINAIGVIVRGRKAKDATQEDIESNNK